MTTLLVVEDNFLLATTLVRFLRDQGKIFVTAVAPSAELALEQLEQRLVDLILVDIALPGMSGIDFIATVRAQYPNVPCLVLSGHNELDYVWRALAVGARGYVLKSDPLAILEGIKQVLAGETYLSDELRRRLYH